MKNKFWEIYKGDVFKFIIVCVIYIVAAVNLVGYFHPDEHFQIMEFANYKMGRSDGNHMPWEFNYEMRSSFQPWIAYLVIKILNLIHIVNPYSIGLVLRLITVVLSLFAVHSFIGATKSSLDKRFQLPYVWFSYFAWFIPYLSVRFSSEIWSGMFFLLAVSCLVPEDRKNYRYSTVGGLLCGISFLCRFQSAIMTFGLVLWLLIVQRRKVKQVLVLLCAVFLVILFGVYIDFLYYGDWTLSMWNYFNMNILYDMASDFGTMTIYGFIKSTFEQILFPFGILTMFFLTVLIIKTPRSFAVWCTVPLLLLHLLVPHKEVRFLFPLAYFVPFIVWGGISETYRSLQNTVFTGWQRMIVFFLGTSIALLNFLSLGIAIFSPPLHGRTVITKYVYDHYSKQKTHLYSIRLSNPFIPYSALRQSFYEMKNMEYTRIENYDTLSSIHAPQNEVSLLTIKKIELKDYSLRQLLATSKITFLESGSPTWVDSVKKALGFEDNSEYILYRIL